MPRITTLKQLARPSGVVFFAALGQALGGVLALALAYRYADVLREGGLGIGVLLLLGGALGCGLALLPTHVLSLLCGWAFGLPVGLAVALCGATLGSPLGYVIGQRLAGPGAMQVIARNPRGAAVCEAITRSSKPRAFLLISLLRLSPVVPYGSTNVLAAVFGVPMLPFVLGTAKSLSRRACHAKCSPCTSEISSPLFANTPAIPARSSPPKSTASALASLRSQNNSAS